MQTSFLYKPVPPEVLTAELRRLLDGATVSTGQHLEPA
jgi:hypothetical protein